MANSNPKGGFTPVRMANGQPYQGSGRAYFYPSNGSTVLGVGDVVVKLGSANTTAITVNGTSGRIMGAAEFPIGALETVAQVAGGTNACTGVVVGVGIDPTGTMAGPAYVPLNTNAVVFVEDDPNVIFEVQSDGAASTHTYADIGNNANIVVAAASAVTGRSGMKLDSSAISTGATKQLEIYGVSRAIDRADMTAAGVSFLVKINNHTEVPNLAGV